MSARKPSIDVTAPGWIEKLQEKEKARNERKADPERIEQTPAELRGLKLPTLEQLKKSVRRERPERFE